MYYGGAESWNLRDAYMAETLEHLLDHGGPSAKAIVWAHNSHIGDARATDMGAVRGEHNIGQLARRKWGDEVALIGFGTHAGTVSAATDWNGDREVKRVLPSRSDSYERLAMTPGSSASCFCLLPTRPCARDYRSRDWSASSASSTARRPSDGVITAKRCYPISSMATYGSTKRLRSNRPDTSRTTPHPTLFRSASERLVPETGSLHRVGDTFHRAWLA
jgi:erythromycin esterase-like protein